ncbi:hypothetical protein G4X40_09455 [Rhodococcus sp. D2-41]|nr:hypothetical protein [Rhodococcus sp. D2-41]
MVWGPALWHYVRRAPGTFIWLAILLATTLTLRHLPEHVQHHILGARSTNLHHLAQDPLRVLVLSAFWLEGGGWLSYLVIYNIFHVPAERWLGTLRWLAVVVIAHVGATYISEGVLYWAIQHDDAPHRAIFTLDVGVSYGLMGIVGILTYRIARPWRWIYLAGVFLVVVIPLVEDRNFTDLGHFTAVLIGLACYPLIGSRAGTWDPMVTARDWIGRLRRRSVGHERTA